MQRNTIHLLRCLLVVYFCLISTAHSQEANTVKDLDYGVALYDLYQQRFYSSAVYLDASLKLKKLHHHREDAELLLGSMMLYYGMHDDAEDIFKRFAKTTGSSVSNRAWFYMAKLRYQRGLFESGLKALLNIKGEFPLELQGERFRLQAMLLMALGRYSLAAEMTSQTIAKNDLFTQYNLAVAFNRSEKGVESFTILEQLIQADANNEQERMLQDKARIILAQLYIKQEKVIAAIELLHQVPLKGVFSDQALITLSWAYYKQGENPKALAPLRLLKERNSSDIQAKEAWLLQGYILEYADAKHEAKKSYDSAIIHYQKEIAKVDDAIESLQNGRFLEQLLPQLRGASQGWGWEGKLDLPKESAPYVAVMLASYQFFEALQNLRDLRYLSDQLATWDDDMPSYQHMLKLRQARYNELLPLLSLVKKDDQFKLLMSNFQAITQQLNNVVSSDDIYQLVDESQKKQLKRLESISSILEKLPVGEKRDDYQARYTLLKGRMIWSLSADFKQRIWLRQKQLNAQHKTLVSIEVKRDALASAKLTTPKMFADYQQQISVMDKQIKSLKLRVDELYTLQEEDVLRLAADALQQYRSQIELYRDQAYYRVAFIKDGALNKMGVSQ